MAEVEIKYVSRKDAAKMLCVSPIMLNNKEWRARIGLTTRKVGGKLIFSIQEIEELLENSILKD